MTEIAVCIKLHVLPEEKVAFKIAKCYVLPQLRLHILLYLLTLEACHKSTSTMM